ncbi:hypothetical protein, partial [Tritonibacter sp. SIMBA_163]|uniref:hypothetical protein n=1 Tax=Tritonibacter sp. SIMBA_163 TaxID=3080868 RepID=UPI00397EB2E3
MNATTYAKEAAIQVLGKTPLVSNGRQDVSPPRRRPGDQLDASTRSAIRAEVQHSETAIVLKRWMIGVLIAIMGQAAISIWWAGRID